MVSILIIDDTNSKLAKVISCIKELQIDTDIDTAMDLVNGRKLLSKRKYDLLILDAVLPERKDGELVENGGLKLLNEIEIRDRYINPSHIIGLTQHETKLENFDRMWITLYFDNTSEVWSETIKRKVKYIHDASKYVSSEVIHKPTIFVEGLSDQIIFKECVTLFYPSLTELVEIQADKNGGSNWVCNKLVGWAFNMPKNNEELVLSCGIFDNDTAGLEAIRELNEQIPNSGTRSQMTKSFKLEYKYASHILEIVKKGIKMPLTLEEMFSVDVWSHAESVNWLEGRGDVKTILMSCDWNPVDQTLEDFLTDRALTIEEVRYFKKSCKAESKMDFANYVIGLETEKRKEILQNHKLLIDECLKFLKLI